MLNGEKRMAIKIEIIILEIINLICHNKNVKIGRHFD